MLLMCWGLLCLEGFGSCLEGIGSWAGLGGRFEGELDF